MAVEFRVLGPLEIRRDGAPVPLRAPAQRTFLAALLVEHGRVVSVDALADALWPDEQPRSARHALEMNASRVRRLLGDDATVVARSPGYLLEVDPGVIDSVRFERLVAEARELEPVRAAARAADALALWRGSAYADFTFAEFAQEEIARLEELRQEVEEERIEAELQLGHAAELIGELEALVAAAPLRERRHAQLMRALYRAGRQADALAAYHDARERLLDELGLEPGAELRELERAILQQDPSLDVGGPLRVDARAERRPASVVAVEPEIPLDLDPEEHERRKRHAAELVGRVAEHFDALQPEPFVLAFAHEDHAERAAAAAAELGERVGIASGEALVGNGGVGGPLVELARRRARDGGAAARAAPAVERPVDTPFVGRDAELAQLRAARAAIVVGPPGIGKSRLLHELSSAEVVVVGRCRAYGAEALAPLHELAAALGAPDALAGVRAEEIPLTLRRLCESATPHTVAFDDVQWASPPVLQTIEYLAAHVRVVCLARDELLEEQPLFLPGAERVRLAPLDDADAVRLAGGDTEIAARAEGNPLFIQQLRAHAVETDAPLPTTLRALLAARLDRLTPTERAAIQRAAVIGRDVDAALVDARPAIASLVRRSLLEPAPPTTAYQERFRFVHALICEAAYESIPQEERARLHEELADTLDGRGASDEIVGFHLERAAELWPARDRHARRLAEDAGRRLGAAGIEFWKRGDAGSTTRLLGRALELSPMLESLWCEYATALATLGQLDDAEAALTTAAASHDRGIALRAQLELEAIAAVRGADDEAQPFLERADDAIRVFETVGDDRSLGRALMLSGWLYGGALDQHEEWRSRAERALIHYERAGWPASTCIGHIAAALYLGPTPVPAAIERCTELAGTDESTAAAGVSAHLAGLYGMTGDFARAAALLEYSRELYTDLGRTAALHRTCAPIDARTARLQGDLGRAADVYRRTCETLRAEQAWFHLSTQAAELADVLVSLGDVDEAERWCTLAESHARDVNSRVACGIARGRLLAHGAADAEAGAEAIAVASAAVELADTTDNLNLRAAAHAAVWTIGGVDGEHARALELYAQKGNHAAAEQLRRGDV